MKKIFRQILSIGLTCGAIVMFTSIPTTTTACDEIVEVVKYKDRFCLFGGWRCVVEKTKCKGEIQ